MSERRYCKDCRWTSGYAQMMICRHPEADGDPVTGDAYAMFERRQVGRCGPTGENWQMKLQLPEPKPKPQASRLPFLQWLFGRAT